jgi:hypothetical protein
MVVGIGLLLAANAALACCPAPMFNSPVVNADQTVIMIWDAEQQTQHFIRQASFKSTGDHFGFLVPTPAQPELEESGDAAFEKLAQITAPEIKTVWQPRCPFACSSTLGHSDGLMWGALPPVRVLDEKRVAGFNAVVLEADSATALVGWLKDNEFAYSPEIAAWAEPYVKQGWKITALKVAKDQANRQERTVSAAALRISFHTERPLFPYREPDMRTFAADLGATRRVLRLYFLADGRYEGELTPAVPWTGKVVWAGKVSAKDRGELLAQLRLPPRTGPRDWRLTEFEDEWPYRPAPADLYFRRCVNQDNVRRPPSIRYVQSPYPTDMTVFALATMMIVPPVWMRVRRQWWFKGAGSTASV